MNIVYKINKLCFFMMFPLFLVACGGGSSSSPGFTPTTYAYMVGFEGGYNQCVVSSNGILSKCQNVNNSQINASAITFDNDYAYLAGNTLTKCSIDRLTGNLNNCSVFTPNLNGASGVTTYNKQLYITNDTTNSGNASYILQCSTSSPGNCGEMASPLSGGGILADPSAIAIANGFAYITNTDMYGSESIGPAYTTCAIESTTGNLNGCNSIYTLPPTNGLLVRSTGVAINNNFAYFANFNHSYTKCGINSTTGALENCSTAVIAFSPQSIAIIGNIAYLPSLTKVDQMHQCNIDATTGDLNNCTTYQLEGLKNNTSLQYVVGIAFYTTH